MSLNQLPDGTLTCAFGSPWVGSPSVGGYHCIHCALEGLRLRREFAAKVASGESDAEGYTPADRRVSVKRNGRS